MKDYENGGHCMRQNLIYNEKHLLLCVNTHRQFILLCWATRGYFQFWGEKGEEGSYHVQMDLSRVMSLSSTESSGQFLLCDPKTSGKASLCLACSLLSTWGYWGWLKTFICIQSLNEDQERANPPTLDALRAGQGCVQYHWLWLCLYSTLLVERSKPPVRLCGLFGKAVKRKEAIEQCI